MRPAWGATIAPCRSAQAADRAILNALAASLVEDSTNESSEAVEEADKNPAAVQLGRRGGLKGGRARAAKMTPEARREAAQHAARARWAQEKG